VLSGTRALVVAVCLAAASGGCDRGLPTERGDEAAGLEARIALGQQAFVGQCASCHASGDGLDLAFFAFPDSTIVRRAVAHVDSTAAWNIARYIRSLGAPAASRELRLFQPGGALLGSDLEFAVNLFGSDSWPVGLTTAQLRAIDPTVVRVAVPFPLWSVERDNTDWMPGRPIPGAILDAQGGLVRGALGAYRAAPSDANLQRAISALRSADRNTSAGAPCQLNQPALARWEECFEVRRWASTLVAQHMFRNGINDAISPVAHAVWWDAGDVARHASLAGVAFPNLELNWASWMYLGWIFDPERRASAYTATGLNSISLPRHATFVALRSQVARPAGSLSVYQDAETASVFAPHHWIYATTRFAFQHLLERQGAGDLPPPDERADAALRVQRVQNRAALRVGTAARAELAAMARELVAGLQQ
jgi:hypothetical protein